MSASVPGDLVGSWPSNTIDTRVRPGFQIKGALFAGVMEVTKPCTAHVKNCVVTKIRRTR